MTAKARFRQHGANPGFEEIVISLGQERARHRQDEKRDAENAEKKTSRERLPRAVIGTGVEAKL